MEVRNSVPSSAGSYYPVGASIPQVVPQVGASQAQKDQLVSLGASLPRKSSHNISSSDPEVLFRLWTRVRRVFFGFALVGLSLFLILVSLPILAVVLSLGICLMGGCQEWWEFTRAVFMVSVWPGACFLLGLLGLAVSVTMMERVADQLPSDLMATDPLRFLARRKSKKSKE